MRFSLFPSIPNSKRVRELRDFYWDVEVEGEELSIAFMGGKPLARIRAAWSLTSPRWMGDVLVLGDRGEFIIAVDRGLILSLEAEEILLKNRSLDRDERRLSTRTRAGYLEVYFEWGDDLVYKSAGGGLVGLTCPDADYPLMVFVGTNRSRNVLDTVMEHLQSTDMGAVIATTQSFANSQPELEFTPEIDALWEFVHQLHRVNTYEPEPPFIYNWECPTRTDRYGARVAGHWDTMHIMWDWMFVDATRARQEFENYLKCYDPDSMQMALDVAPLTEDVWPKGHRGAHEGRCVVCSHPPVWPEIAWNLYLVTPDRSFLAVLYEVAKRNITWWETHRDRDGDGLFEYADTGFPQPWESGYDGSPRFDHIGVRRFACVDLNAQLVMYYRNLVRFAVEMGETDAAQEYAAKQKALAERLRDRLYDPGSGWFYDRNADGFVKVKSISGLWPMVAGAATPEQTEALITHVEDPLQFATSFPLPSVSVDDEHFEPVSWRGPCWASQVLWFATGLRQAGRTELAGRLIRRALDVMGEVLGRDGTVYEFYSPNGTGQESLRLFDTEGSTEPVRRYYMGHAPVRAMVLSGLFGIRPSRDGLIIDPAAESIPDGAHAAFKVGEARFTLDARKGPEGLEAVIRRGSKTVASGYGRMLVPRVELL